MASLRKQQGGLQEAEILYKQALVGRVAQIEADHPNTHKTLIRSLDFYSEQGRIGRRKWWTNECIGTLHSEQSMSLSISFCTMQHH